jgi:hypothetical protein
MANEYTLADYEAMAPDNLNKAVIRTWREASPILDMLTFKSDAQLSQRFMRFSSLPTTHWRKIGETFQDVKINPDFLAERLYFFGDKIDIPYEYVKAPSIVNNRAIQEEAVLKAQAFMFNESFFIGTPTLDEDGLVGLHYRLINDFAAAQSYDAGGIDISPNTATASVWNDFFDVLGELLDRVDGEDSQKVLFMNRTVYMRAQALMRRSQLLNTTQDNLGRTFMTYGQGGPKLVQVGYKVDQSTQILPDTELSNGTALTGGATSSIFCTRFGEPYLAGWNQEAPFAEDVGLIEARTHYRTVVRGSAGLYINHPRAIARAYNIVAA